METAILIKDKTRADLVDTFLSNLPAEIRQQLDPISLLVVIESWLEAAKTAWPDVTQCPNDFLEYVAKRFPLAGNARDTLHKLPILDLYLACACVCQNENAIAAFEKRYFAEISAALLRLKHSQIIIEEVKSALREKLFVGTSEEKPYINQYMGKGPLAGWLYVSAVRAAQRLQQCTNKESNLREDENLADRLANNPEHSLFQLQYKAEFRSAIKTAIKALTPRQRTILRYHYLDGIEQKKIAELYGVHRITVSRWLDEALSLVRANVKQYFARQFSMDSSEYDSLCNLCQSQIEVSISSIFREDLTMN